MNKEKNNEILMKLLKGNKGYYTTDDIRIIPQGKKGEDLTREPQKPEVIVLACSDSRVPVESIFDAKLGEIFVIRTAGHIIDDSVLASIEYGIYHLGIRLIIVMGHTFCGAVQAAITKTEEAKEPQHVPSIVSKVKKRLDGNTDRSICERLNILATINELYEELDLSLLEEGDEMSIRAGIYHMTTGIVDIF